MELIIVLVALGLERFVTLGQHLNRFSWFGWYLNLMQPLLNKTANWGKAFHLGVVLLPFPLIMGFILWLFGHGPLGIVGLVLGIGVLLYCFGPEDLFDQLRRYGVAYESLDVDEAKEIAIQIQTLKAPHEQDGAQIIPTTTEVDALNHRATVEASFIQANDRYFAVIFWFILLGGFGAVLYRMTSLLSREHQHPLVHAAEKLRRVMDWVPVRLVTFSFLLVGQFGQGFHLWWSRIREGLNANDDILMSNGLFACGLAGEEEAELAPADLQKALQLIERAMYVWVVVIGLVTLGSWLF